MVREARAGRSSDAVWGHDVVGEEGTAWEMQLFGHQARFEGAKAVGLVLISILAVDLLLSFSV